MRKRFAELFLPQLLHEEFRSRSLQRFKMYLKTNFSRKLFVMNEIHDFVFSKNVFYNVFPYMYVHIFVIMYLSVRLFILLIIR